MNYHHYELQEFHSGVAPTGSSLIRLIKENELEDYEFFTFTKTVDLDGAGYSMNIHSYKYTITFRRKVERA